MVVDCLAKNSLGSTSICNIYESITFQVSVIAIDLEGRCGAVVA